ncbi:site-specific integrase [Pontimicrobium aquaticum]|uniref:site-specific integrase n=1 Tax=Pontimicrobium aquaticum TaxID=2565367 RepID=UPI00145DE2F3|nr:site-specific integrase [Pontimicrobium aquaticum]
MKREYSISIYLDTRRPKSNGKYPVKLRVFSSNPRKQKLFPTVFDLTKKEFDSIWLSTKPRNKNKKIRMQIQAIETKANEIADKLNIFSFEQFERKMFREKGEGTKISYHYHQLIEHYRKNNRLGTADSYKYSEKAISEFVENKNKKYNKLSFFDIDKNWLNEFENYLKITGRSITTVGIFLRPLRAIFNKAIAENEIEQEIYPFGKRKYQIPSSRASKKALTREQLKILFNSTPSTPEQEKAKAFWFFSFNSNGINIKDIALLKFKNIDGETIKFYRAKTLFTSKSDLKPITIYLNDYAKSFIEKYSNKNTHPENYVFDIISETMNAEEQRLKIKGFTRFINQHLKKLCKSIGLPNEISTYWARHSFATTSIRKGATMELIQESLGHKNIKTTQSYFNGFEDETKKELAKQLMDF